MPRECQKKRLASSPPFASWERGFFRASTAGAGGDALGLPCRVAPCGQQGQGTRVSPCWGPQQVLCCRSAAPQGVGQGFQGGFYTGIWSLGAALP